MSALVVCPGGGRYEIPICGRCDLQVERNHQDRWECPRHGDRIAVRVAAVRSAPLVLGVALTEKGQ